MTHTPGPWTVTGQSEGGRYITVKAANRRTVARVPFSVVTDETPLEEITDAADANLIAAAPDMLAELEAVAIRLENIGLDFDSVVRVIAKAKGTTQ